MSMDKIEMELEHEKETPKTQRYDWPNPDEPPKVRALYIQKHAINAEEPPERIKLTIEEVEEEEE